ncbi:tetratricopeptide repeat protein [Amycolatopsis pithecellobii]|uniref:Tetratricopeptide repeat protein n=1 Tax=Amycolatopsis pithecellobii TaxID=664692 RepID=A0A6N7YPI2_9PSEU|nr:tetratricopeptide repeat protein [Amycolatopsis pithecellobii]MTD53912.1 tetratricopeptide repeat protein [Amycolatopsis pithecellobii]
MPRKSRPVTEPAELPEPHRVRWWLALAAFLAAAVALFTVPYFLSWPGRPGSGATVSTTVTWTLVQATCITALLVLALYSVGRGRLEHDAYHALRISVEVFGNSDGDCGVPALELTAGFKRELGNSRLYRPTAVPGSVSSYDFITIVETAGDGASNGLWKVLARLVRLGSPPCAYSVKGTVLPPGQGPVTTHRLLIELVRLPNFAASPLVIEDTSWERVLERAASSVAALVMPRSEFCNSAHWSAWRGAAIPPELFDAYQRAHHFRTERRYDEALAEYHRALEYDPTNVYIRLEIGYLQEQLDLFLDALVTYDDIIIICSRSDPVLADWWNTDDFAIENSPRAGDFETAKLLARFRHATVLGQGDWVAEQWWRREEGCAHPAHWSRRETQRAHLRRVISRRFDHRYHDIDELTDRDSVLAIPAPGARQDDSKSHAIELRSYLCALSQYELERLRYDYYPSSFFKRRPTRHVADVLSQNSVKVALAWIALRRGMAFAGAGKPGVALGQLFTKVEPIPEILALYDAGQWPPPSTALKSAVEATLSKRLNGSTWHEHYNAACAYAVALLPTDRFDETDQGPDLDRGERENIAKLAVRELYRAAAGSHTGFIAKVRDFALSEDPDLAALRGQPAFRNFEMVTFALPRPASLRPTRLHVWEQLVYMGSLVHAAAQCLAQIWEGVTPEQHHDVRLARELYATEDEAWKQIQDLAVNRRDWLTRTGTIVKLRKLARKYGFGERVVRYPLYSDEMLFRTYEGFAGGDALRGVREGAEGIALINEVAGAHIRGCENRMDELAELFRDPAPAADACPNRPLRAPNITRPPREERQLGKWFQPSSRARLWAALANWFDDGILDEPAAERARTFKERLAQAGI